MQMTSDDKAKFKALYIQTARGYIRDIQKNTAVLQSQTDNAEALNAVHLASHSLTSQSTLMGYTQLSSVTSAIEHYSKARMEDHNACTSETISAIIEAATVLFHSVDEIEKSDNEPNLSELLSRLKTAGI